MTLLPLVELEASAAGPLLSNPRKLVASDGADDDRFGTSVAISGDTLIVGAEPEPPSSSGAEAAYVYQRDAGGTDNWGEVKKITDPVGAEADFGTLVAVSGDTALVSESGGVHVFERDLGGPDNWGHVKKIVSSDGATFSAVAIDGDTVIAGTQALAGGGAVYVFERDAGGTDNWGEVKRITASDAAPSDSFGARVSISGDTVIVGSPLNDELGTAAGAAYVLERDEGGADNWGEVQKIAGSDVSTGSFFGWAVAISGETAIVGARPLSDPGAAYVFERDEGGPDEWGEVKKIESSDGAAVASFGHVLALSGDTAVIAARPHNSTSVGEETAYVFQRDFGGTDNWGEAKKMTAPDPVGFDYVYFSSSLALDGATVVLGAAGDDSAGHDQSGSAYVYFTPDFCAASPQLGCTEGWGKASLLINEKKSGGQKIDADFKNGPALAQANFGDPLAPGGTAYRFCLYDDGGVLVAALQVDRAGLECADRDCWTSLGPPPPAGLGYRYNDRDARADGVGEIRLLGGAVGKTKIRLRAKNKGSNETLSLPTGVAAALLGSTSATLQVVSSDAGCFSATLGEVTRSDETLFKAR